MNYQEIKNRQPELVDCFFAFSNSQFSEGIIKNNLQDKKIYSAGMGLYGTQEGIAQLMKYYDDLNEEIAAKCDPQEVYDYEFNNHECSYTCDDTDAIKIVASIFGNEKTATVKRKFAVMSIINLFED